MYSQKLTCSDLFQFLHSCICERFIYILRISLLFGCRKIGRLILGIYKSLTDTWMRKLGDRTFQFCSGNNEATQFHYWEYINTNQTFLLDSHLPLICSAGQPGWQKKGTGEADWDGDGSCKGFLYRPAYLRATQLRWKVNKNCSVCRSSFISKRGRNVLYALFFCCMYGVHTKYVKSACVKTL